MFLVLSRAWDKEKILSPHKELSLRPESKGLRFDSPCDFPHFSLSHTRDKMKNIFLYFWNFLKILTQHFRLSRSLKLFFSGNYVRIVWLPGMYSSQRVFQYANFYLVFSFSVLCICFFLLQCYCIQVYLKNSRRRKSSRKISTYQR